MMIKKKRGYVAVTWTAIACWMVFIWLRTFTNMANYDEGTGVYGSLITGIVTLCLTMFYWFCFKPDDKRYGRMSSVLHRE